ncbi:hypothetical protein V496_00318 [Pseudogymnoascus sp. VKM F-4515 (FW-2607)]|nr:hypothetical protein V496_00318 [Pseudogymnoascus sp. VKM F-4515 (FW-2607)]
MPRGASTNTPSPFNIANGTNTTAGPLGGTLITDPVRLGFFTLLHDQVLESLNNGSALPVRIPISGVDSTVDPGNGTANPLAERQDTAAMLIAGLFILLAELGADVGTILGEIAKLFGGSTKEWWDQTSRCRTHFQTHGGGQEKIETFAKESDKATTSKDSDIYWNNPSSTAPPILYYDDPDIGPYSVQFTATDTVAWSGIPDTEKCYIQGLCNPQYVFYHKQYNLALNTWQSQGDISSCQYSNGEDCKGLCMSGVLDQFSKDGDVWGGKCAIPCYDELPAGLPTVAKQSPKIMVVGDSISHGMQDDWTWRYRLWSWLNDLGYEATFVGFYDGTHGTPGLASSEPSAPLLDGEKALNFIVTGGYANGVSSNFTSSGHSAFWGRQAAQVEPMINGWVKQYQPDYMLTLLGFNDLGWWVSGPEGLIGNMGNIVENAREAKPDIKVLVGNVVQRLFIEGRQDLVDNTNKYNALLKSTMSGWFRWESPIAYVDVEANYDCQPANCPDGYDGLHPLAMGEHHIAQAFANVLGSDFNFPGNPYTVPASVDARPVSVPTNVVSYAYPEGVFTTWDSMHNNRGYEIRSRLQGMTDWWSSGNVAPNTWGSWLSWVQDGQIWESQVRTIGNIADRSDWSPLVSVTAHPKTAPGPSPIGVVPVGSDSVTVSWSAVGGYDVNRYGVVLWDRDTAGSFISTYATTSTSLTVSGLISGHHYDVWVATYVNMAKGSLTSFGVTPGGVPASAHGVIIGGGVPGPPASLTLNVIDATSIELHWPATPNAVGYTIYMKSLITAGAGFQSVGQTTELSQAIGFLFPGIWNYEFCIGSYNGDYQSSYGNACVIPPRCCGYKRDEPVLSTTSTSGNGTIQGPTLVSLTNVNATAITTDPEGGQLYRLYTQAIAALQKAKEKDTLCYSVDA